MLITVRASDEPPPFSGFVKGGPVSAAAHVQLCCGFSLLNIMLLFRLDRRDFFFFFIKAEQPCSEMV